MDNGFIAHQVQFTVGQRRLVDDISLTLPPGEMVALIGPNGAGKSTLLRLLTGFLTPSRGVCSWRENPLPPGLRRRCRAIGR